GCRFSSLRRMSGLFGPSLRRKSGVRTTFPAMRRRASCMSSRVILLTAASVAGIGGFHLRLFDRRDPRAEGRERDALADTAAFEARGARQECPAARSFEPRRARAEGDALLLPRHVERHHDRRAARRDPRVSEHARAAPGGATIVVSLNIDRKSTRLNSSHRTISYAVFCLKKKNHNV